MYVFTSIMNVYGGELLDQILDDKYKDGVGLVVRALKHTSLESGKSSFTFDTDSVANLEREETIGRLKYLQNQGALKYIPPDTDFSEVDLYSVDYNNDTPRIVAIELHGQQFDKLYEKYVQSAKTTPPTAQNDIQKINVRLKKDGLNLYLEASDGQYIKLNRFRADLTPERLVDYLLSHSNAVLQLTQIRLEGPGFPKITNIGEKLRKAGFTETVKRFFLPENDSKKVRLRDTAEMTIGDFEKIKTELHSTT